MKKENLISLGLTDEQASKTVNLFNEELKSYIPKSLFDEVNEVKKQAEKQLIERDTQLEELKKSSGNNEELQRKIKTLQEENKTSKAKYETDIKELKLNNAIKLVLLGKAQDDDLVAGLIDKSKLVLDENGKITGLDEQIKTLQENKSFLFKQKSESIINYKPQTGNTLITNPWSKEHFNLTEQGRIFKENPIQAKELASAVGISI